MWGDQCDINLEINEVYGIYNGRINVDNYNIKSINTIEETDIVKNPKNYLSTE